MKVTTIEILAMSQEGQKLSDEQKQAELEDAALSTVVQEIMDFCGHSAENHDMAAIIRVWASHYDYRKRPPLEQVALDYHEMHWSPRKFVEHYLYSEGWTQDMVIVYGQKQAAAGGISWAHEIQPYAERLFGRTYAQALAELNS